MRLHVRDPRAGHPGERLERADLVEHVGAKIVRLDVDEAPAEPGEIAVADLGADRDAALGRRVHTRAMIDGSPAWKPQATFALVTTSRSASSSPSAQCAEALTEVGVEVHATY